MSRIYGILSLFLCMTGAVSVRAQATAKTVEHREQAWLGYFTQTRLSNKWGFWLEAHYRSTGDFVDRTFQVLIRPAVIYYLNDRVRFNVGYAYARLYPVHAGGVVRPEHRPWQQVAWNQKYNRFSMMQWIRLEERFVHKSSGDQLIDGYNFNYRVRYNMAFFVPLNRTELLPRTPFLVGMNEVFLNFGDKIVYNTFDQNRLFAGLGYQFTKHFSAHLGYMNVFQQDASGSKYISTDAIRLFVYHNFDLRRQSE